MTASKYLFPVSSVDCSKINGISTRCYIATQILKSLLTRPYDRSEDIVKKSVEIADMLIEATDE